MSESSSHLLHQPRHRREPGPAPTPTKRRSTEPLQENSVSTAPQVAPSPEKPAAPKPRKGVRCGSKKPRYVLAKALLKLALAEGHFELLEEREERLAEEAAARKASDCPQPEEATKEELCIVTCTVGSDGQDKLEFHPIGGGKASHTAGQPKPRRSKTLDEILTERKVRQALEKMKEVQVVVNIGELVRAALQDENLSKLLEKTKIPSCPEPPLRSVTKKSKDKRSSSAGGSIRGTLPTSYRGFTGNKNKDKPVKSAPRPGSTRRKIH